MKLFELIDRWQRRKELRRIIFELEKKMTDNKSSLAYIQDIGLDLHEQRALATHILNENKALMEQLKFYKNKLNDLL